MRLQEPFIKAHLALWLAGEGATAITVSIDGAEPNASCIQEILLAEGFSHEVNRKSRARWTGKYWRGGTTISVISRPGVDVRALLADGRLFQAECKGEPTTKGTRAGNDQTAFYTGLGQLLMTSGRSTQSPDVAALVLPDTERFARWATEASRNQFLKGLNLKWLLVRADGQVRGIE